MTTLYWMDIPALNTSANYPSDGKGGVTTSQASSLFAGYGNQKGFRFLGVIVLGVESTGTTTVTLTDAAGATFTLELQDTPTPIGSFLALPELDGISVSNYSNNFLTIGTSAKTAQVSLDGGVPVGAFFTLEQDVSTTGGSSVRGLFVAD